LRRLDHPRIRALVAYLEGQRDELLTYLDWLEVQLAPWQRQLGRAIPDPAQQSLFQSAVARAWWLTRAVVNGHTAFRPLAEEAQARLVALIAQDSTLHHVAEALFNILEGVIALSSIFDRTSCAAETINSIPNLICGSNGASRVGRPPRTS
jgi:hypothetical protein